VQSVVGTFAGRSPLVKSLVDPVDPVADPDCHR
jgi:hypothetical protein